MVEAICSYDPSKEPDFYELLGCHETSNVEQINTEFKIRALKEHPDKNHGDDNYSAETFKLLQQAKEVLTNETKRADYDKWRRSGMAISYKQWCGLGECARTTMHWASKPQTKPMIEAELSKPKETKTANSTSDTDHVIGGIVWQRQQGNDLLKKFRNYEI